MKLELVLSTRWESGFVGEEGLRGKLRLSRRWTIVKVDKFGKTGKEGLCPHYVSEIRSDWI